MFEFSEYENFMAPVPIFLPEVGTFFNQDLKQAETLIDQLLFCGVKAIKGEILQNPNVALDIDFEAGYYDKRDKTIKKENYRQLIKRKVVSFEQYERVFSVPKNKGVELVFSVYDIEGADFAISIGADVLKVASSNLVHQPLISYIAQKKVPTIIDTGKAHLYEIARAVEWFRQAGGKDLLLEHSPLGPPAPASNQYLSMMPFLQKTFQCPVGLSDHYDGTEMLLASIPLGASILEKGIILESMLGEQDTSHAMLISEVPNLLQQVEKISEATKYGIRPSPDTTHPARMGLVARNMINKGEVLSLENTYFAWPAAGVKVENWPEVEGAELRTDVKKDSPIETWMLA